MTEVVVSYDGQYVFTAGGEDCTVNMWTVNTLWVCVCVCVIILCVGDFIYKIIMFFSSFCSSLEANALLGGEDLEPFYSLIEGGREGTFFSELEEFFYYVQMRR